MKTRLLALIPQELRKSVLDCFLLVNHGELLGSRLVRLTVRTTRSAQIPLLKLSGQNGLFLRPLFRTEAERAETSVVWLDTTSSLDAALEVAARHPSTLGLVRNDRGLGIRVPAGEYGTL